MSEIGGYLGEQEFSDCHNRLIERLQKQVNLGRGAEVYNIINPKTYGVRKGYLVIFTKDQALRELRNYPQSDYSVYMVEMFWYASLKA